MVFLALAGAAWLAVAVSIVVDFAGLRSPRTRASRWWWSGLLVLLTGAVLSQMAGIGNWPFSLRDRFVLATPFGVGAGDRRLRR